MIVHDPSDEWETRAYFSTCLHDAPATIVERFLKRWTIETTFEESRAHLGIETHRQWSNMAIERETPCLLGLYSVVALIGAELNQAGRMLVQSTSWHSKPEASFADVLAATRSCLWNEAVGIFLDPDDDASPEENQRRVWQRLVATVRYSHGNAESRDLARYSKELARRLMLQVIHAGLAAPGSARGRTGSSGPSGPPTFRREGYEPGPSPVRRRPAGCRSAGPSTNRRSAGNSDPPSLRGRDHFRRSEYA